MASTSYNDKDVIRAPLKPTPSPLYNNLAQADGNLVYAHNRSAVILSPTSVSQNVPVPVRRVDTQSMDSIHMVQACHINPTTTFVILGSEGGVQVWDKTCSNLLHTWTMPEQEQAGPSSTVSTFARGAALVHAKDGSINLCIGTSRGSIFVMKVGEDGRLGPHALLNNHTSPITCLGSAYQSRRGSWTAEHGSALVSCDQEGQITVWEAHSSADLRVTNTIAASNVPITAVVVRRDMLIVARMDGNLQIYSMTSLKLTAEIASHSRWITAMDIHPSKDIIASVAEDATVSVWALATAEQKIKCLLSSNWMHAMPIGVAFCGPNSDDIAVAALDTEELRIYKPLK